MKKPLALLTVTALTAASMEVFSAGTMTGFAASLNMKTKNILLDGKRISSPVGIAAVDPSNKKLTTYMPIYYVGTLLQSLGIQNHWDGHTWKLTAPTARIPGGKVVPPKSVSKNAVMITLNGSTIASAPRIVATDPASRKQTTFVPIWYVMQVLKQLNVVSDWNGTTWSLVDVKPLSDALKNTNNAIPRQSNMTMDMRTHLNLTSRGQQDLGSDPSVTDDHVTITSTSLTGMVNGEHATNVQMAYHDFGDSSQDDFIQVYGQGQHVYLNDNNSGWTDISNHPEAQRIVQEAESNNVDVKLQELSKVTITSSADGKVYQGVINLSASSDMENAVLDDWTDTDTSPAEKQALVKELEKRASVSVAYTMKTVQGTNQIANMKATLHLNIPVSALPSSERQSLQGEVSSIDVTETITLANSFDNITITPPSGLPGQSGSGNASNGQSGSSGGNTSGSGSSSTTGDTTGSSSGGSSSGQSGSSGGNTSGSGSSSTTGDTTGSGSGNTSNGQGGTTGGDTSGTGTSSTSGGTTGSSTGSPVVQYQWTGYEGNIGSNAVIAGTMVVAADADSNGSIYAYDITSGKRVWAYDQNMYYNGILAGSPTTVLMSQQNGVLALSAASGTPIWSKSIGKPIEMRIVNNKAIVATSNAVYVYDASTGQLQWSKSLSATMVAHVAANDSGMLVATADNNVTAYDWTGQQVFQKQFNGTTNRLGIATGPNQTWLITEPQTITALDTAGNAMWSTNFPSAVEGGNVAVDGNYVYVVTNDDKITKLNAIDGTTVATNDLPLGASCAPTGSDGIVYIVTDLGHLSLVDGSTLQTIQTLYKYGNQQVLHCVDTPLVAFGTVIVQSHQNGYSGDANLVAFR